MIRLPFSGRLSVVVMVAIATAGCGSLGEAARDTKLRNDLKALHVAYRNYMDLNNKGPAGWDDLLHQASQVGDDTAAIQRVRSAGYQVKWGLSTSDMNQAADADVLAQSSGGGPKLMMNGAVQ